MSKSSVCFWDDICLDCTPDHYPQLVEKYGPYIKEYILNLFKNPNTRETLSHESVGDLMNLITEQKNFTDSCGQLKYFLSLLPWVANENCPTKPCGTNSYCLPETKKVCVPCEKATPEILQRAWQTVARTWAELESTRDLWRHRTKYMKEEEKKQLASQYAFPLQLYPYLTERRHPSCETIHFLQHYPSPSELQQKTPFNFFRYFKNSCYCDSVILALFGFPIPWVEEQMHAFPQHLSKYKHDLKTELQKQKKIPSESPLFLCDLDTKTEEDINKIAGVLSTIYDEVKKAIHFVRTPPRICETKKFITPNEVSRCLWKISNPDVKSFEERIDLRGFMDRCSSSTMYFKNMEDPWVFATRLLELLLFDKAALLKVSYLKTDQDTKQVLLRVDNQNKMESVVQHLKIEQGQKETSIQIQLDAMSKPTAKEFTQKDTGKRIQELEQRILWSSPYLMLNFPRIGNSTPLLPNPEIKLPGGDRLYLYAIIAAEPAHYVLYFKDFKERKNPYFPWFYYNDMNAENKLSLEIIDFDSVFTNVRRKGNLFFYSK